MTEETDFLIAGAGIVGLAVAAELRSRHPDARIVVLEKEAAVGLHASGRNSGVLHSGVYYTPGTLKARLCAEGARRMLAFVRDNGVAHRVAGKVILAAGPEDLPGLERLERNAAANGIRARRLAPREVLEIEPNAAPGEGLHCPDTAVVDSPAVVRALARRGEAAGVQIVYGENVVSAEESAVQTASGRRYRFHRLINCAGAHADRVARLFGLAADHVLVPFKGLYWKIRPERNGLVKESLYPVPDLAFPFLGVHLTRGAAGDVYAGPTAVPALGRENYGIFEGLRPGEMGQSLWRLARLYAGRDRSFRALVHRELLHYTRRGFLAAARRLVPALREDDLVPAHKVGIRPQLVRRSDDRLEMDFHVEKNERSLHVLNAISPAFTCAFSFAAHLLDSWEKKESTDALAVS